MSQKNYRPTSWYDARVEIRPSHIQGGGMFARAPIAAGEIVAIVGGTVMTEQAANDTHQAALDTHRAASDTHQAALDTHQWYWVSQFPPYLTALGITVASVGSAATWLWSRMQAATKELDTQVHSFVSELESNPATRIATAASLAKYVNIKKGRYAPEIYTTTTSVLQTAADEHKSALTTLNSAAQRQLVRSSRMVN